MEESAGIYRTGRRARAGGRQLEALQERCTRLRLDDHSHTFNTELTSALELSYMLDVAEAIVQSALQRKESRGLAPADRPSRAGRSASSSATPSPTADEAAPRASSTMPVTITRWPPGERVYGR